MPRYNILIIHLQRHSLRIVVQSTSSVVCVQPAEHVHDAPVFRCYPEILVVPYTVVTGTQTALQYYISSSRRDNKILTVRVVFTQESPGESGQSRKALRGKFWRFV
jgi:hypothetical protein